MYNDYVIFSVNLFSYDQSFFGYQPDILYLSRQKRSIDYTSEEHLCLNYITYYQYFYFYYSSVFSGFFNLLNNSNFNYSHCLDFWLVHKMLILIKENNIIHVL